MILGTCYTLPRKLNKQGAHVRGARDVEDQLRVERACGEFPSPLGREGLPCRQVQGQELGDLQGRERYYVIWEKSALKLPRE